MNVTNNMNQMAALYSAALATSGIENAAVTPSEDGKSLTVTMQGVGGSVASTSTVAVPEIDVPTDGTVGDSVQLTNFIKNLNDSVKSLLQLDDASFDKLEKNVKAGLEKAEADLKSTQADPTSTPAPTGKASAIYSIFRLMSLLLEVAREQREIAREQREADTQLMLSTMESQRQAMIDEAVAGWISTLCIAGIQFAMMFGEGLMEKSSNTTKQEAKDITGEQAYKNVAKMSAKAGDPEALQAMTKKTEVKLTNSVDDFLKRSDLTAEERQKYNNPTQKIKSEIGEIDGHTTKAEMAEKLKMPKTDEQGNVLTDDHGNKLLKTGDDFSDQELNDFKADKRTEFYEQCKAERNEVRTRYEEAAEKGKVPEKLKMEMDIANAKVEYAAASKLNNETKQENVPSAAKTEEFKESVNGDMIRAKRESQTTLTDKIAAKQLAAQRLGQVNQAIIQLAKGMVDNGLKFMNAENKKYDQAVTLEREKLDTTKDLVQNALEMFKQMLNVLSSINQAEKESFREIMG